MIRIGKDNHQDNKNGEKDRDAFHDKGAETKSGCRLRDCLDCTSGSPPLVHHWQDGYKNNGKNDKFKILANEREIAKEKAGKREERHPGDATREIIRNKICIGHFSDTGNKRGESADDGDKTRQEDRLAAMLFEERMRSVNIFLFDPLDVVSTLTQIMANGIIHGIPEYRGQHQQPGKIPYIQ